MRAIMALDEMQLCRIDNAIARIMSSSPIARQRSVHLLAALESEREAIIRARSGKRQPRRPPIAA